MLHRLRAFLVKAASTSAEKQRIQVAISTVLGHDVAVIIGHEGVQACDQILMFDFLQDLYLPHQKIELPFFPYLLQIYNFYRDNFPVSIILSPKNLARVPAPKSVVGAVAVVLDPFAEGIEAGSLALAVTGDYHGADYIIILVMGCVGSKTGSAGTLRRSCPQQHSLKYKIRGQVSNNCNVCGETIH